MAAEVGTRAGLHDRATRPKLQAGTQQGTYESVCSSVEVGTVGGWWGMSRKVDRKLPPLPKGFRLSQRGLRGITFRACSLTLPRFPHMWFADF